MTRYMVTAALPYANGPIHIGHLAGCYLPADIFVRYMKLKGEDVLFICGSDEHGVPITIKAEEMKKTPQQVVDYYHDIMEKSFREFGVEFDNFSKTSISLHHKNAQEFFLKLNEKGYISKKIEKQYFCEKCRRFLPDRYVEGTCPHCKSEGARGDQCDACGKVIDNVSLISPKCKLCGANPVIRDTEHFYLDLDKFQDKLKEYLEGRTWWKENVREFSLGWLKDGLKPRAITRDIDWGVKVPIEGYDGKVLYVWFDAPIGYISSTMEYFNRQNKPDEWKKWWTDENSKVIHFLGKDNIVFHAVIWPAMLMGMGGYNLPFDIPANEYLNLEGKKLSTSRNWAVWLDDYLTRHKPDVLRYALASTLPESKDTDFSWTELQQRNNGELADIYGNFINRTIQFITKYNNGLVSENPSLKDEDRDFLDLINGKISVIGKSIEDYSIRKAAYEFMDIAREANKYFTVQEPWVLGKKDRERLGTVLYVCMKAVTALACAGEPFIPFASKKLQKFLSIDRFTWDSIGGIEPPKNIAGKELEILFVKIEDSVIEDEKSRLGRKNEQQIENKTVSDEIAIEDFKKVALVVAKVLKAEKVQGADKLLKLSLDLGTEKREIVAGVALHYKPEELENRKIVIVKNLKPAKLRGIMSQGMLLAASSSDKSRVKILFPDESCEPGDTIG
ncbi:MAG: methionine--tRNA ligase [bacterium]